MNPDYPVNPAPERVLIHVPKVEEKTAGGIILPESTQDQNSHKQEVAYVVKIGEGAFEHFDFRPSPGAKVAINRYAGRFIDEEGTYRIIPWEEIQGEYTDE